MKKIIDKAEYWFHLGEMKQRAYQFCIIQSSMKLDAWVLIEIV